MKVIVGLGNPGRRYHSTRHNVGFDVLDRIAATHGGISTRERFDAEIGDVQDGDLRLLLVAPQTFMNNSGQSVGPLLDFYKLDPSAVLVICDDLNLPLGRLRLRERGSAGGQKGLADVIRRLGTQDVARLRIGIGQPPPRFEATDYVLGRFRDDEQNEIDVAIAEAAEGALLWARSGAAAAMNRLNPSAARPSNADDDPTSKADGLSSPPGG